MNIIKKENINMAKCDVCGKTSLLPEKFGAINVCKVCFMRVNGLFWKRRYERYEDAEKQRDKVLETANKYNFPQPVISAINEFFMNQMNAMFRCDCCGQPVQHLQPLEKTNICKQCFGKINSSAWKETEYDDNEEVEKNRQKVLKVATKNGFPPIIVDDINKYFDSKIQKGLICCLDSENGQKLKVFDTHCILITTTDFDVESTSIAYGKALKSTQPKENLFSNGVAKSLARSVLTGGIVKAGVSIATSAAINVAADKMAPEKGMFRVVKGNCKINYDEYDYVDYQVCDENEVGFIRFRSNRGGGRQNEDIVFFFYYDDKKIDKAYDSICEGISKQIQQNRIVQETVVPVQQVQPTSINSVADEILKFKNLLDQGIITQEEFDAKKKELLNL